jgi:hypothetical protein
MPLGLIRFLTESLAPQIPVRILCRCVRRGEAQAIGGGASTICRVNVQPASAASPQGVGTIRHSGGGDPQGPNNDAAGGGGGGAAGPNGDGAAGDAP